MYRSNGWRWSIFICIVIVCMGLPVSAKTINVPLVIGMEKQTAAKIVDYKTKLSTIISKVNTLLTKNGVDRQFYIDSYAPIYNKDDYPNSPYNLPDVFWKHENTKVYVAIDGTTYGRSWTYYWLPSVIIHGNDRYSPYWDVLSSDAGIYIFAHELMHTVGAIDLYLQNIVSPADNLVSHTDYYNRYDYDIMSSWDTNEYSSYTVKIVNDETFPCACLSWYAFQPESITFVVKDKHDTPIPNANISLYRSSTLGYDKVSIDAIPEYVGITNSSGAYTVNETLFQAYFDEENDTWSYPALVEVKVQYQGKTDYAMLEITNVNEKYWKGETKTMRFGVPTDLDVGAIEPIAEAAWVEQTQGTGAGGAYAAYPGQTIDLTVVFKNTGTSTWENTGDRRVGLYVYKDPTYSTPLEYNNPRSTLFGQSYFANRLTWGPNFPKTQDFTRAALLQETHVAPNETGTFVISFSIPENALPNTNDNPLTRQREDYYREDLTLATGANWMRNTTNGDPLGFAHIWVPIKVLTSTSSATKTITPNITTPTAISSKTPLRITPISG